MCLDPLVTATVVFRPQVHYLIAYVMCPTYLRVHGSKEGGTSKFSIISIIKDIYKPKMEERHVWLNCFQLLFQYACPQFCLRGLDWLWQTVQHANLIQLYTRNGFNRHTLGSFLILFQQAVLALRNLAMFSCNVLSSSRFRGLNRKT